jgi:hypothetical protein
LEISAGEVAYAAEGVLMPFARIKRS